MRPEKRVQRQVERAPEDVYRAGLADEPAAERLEHAVHLDERPPEPAHGVAVIAGVDVVLAERDGVRDLDRHRPDGRGDVERVEHAHDRVVELSDGAGFEVERSNGTGDGGDVESVVDEVEVDLKRRTGGVRHQRRRQSAGRHVERDVPPVVGGRFVGETHLADDLGVELQGVAGVLPIGDRDRRPALGICHGDSSPPRFAHVCAQSRPTHGDAATPRHAQARRPGVRWPAWQTPRSWKRSRRSGRGRATPQTSASRPTDSCAATRAGTPIGRVTPRSSRPPDSKAPRTPTTKRWSSVFVAAHVRAARRAGDRLRPDRFSGRGRGRSPHSRRRAPRRELRAPCRRSHRLRWPRVW